mgnify:CR=1 FL=1
MNANRDVKALLTKYQDSQSEVAKLTEEVERLRKVADQAIKIAEGEWDSEIWTLKDEANESAPELYAYLKDKENQK